MFTISKETMNGVMALKEKMADPKNKAESVAEVEKMIKTKEAHLARADWGACCGNIRNLSPQIESELQMLQDILKVLEAGDNTKAIALLEDYITFLHQNYTPEPEHW
jgi:hypothetical protein